MIKTKNKKGFIALTSVIIIGAVIALLIIGIFKSSVGEMERGGSKEEGERAFYLASLCLETALNKLREDSDYGGDETINIGEESCYISQVDRGNGIIIETEATTLEEYTRKIRAEVAIVGSGLEIAEWQEVE